MSAIVEERTFALNATQRAWLVTMAQALDVCLAQVEPPGLNDKFARDANSTSHYDRSNGKRRARSSLESECQKRSTIRPSQSQKQAFEAHCRTLKPEVQRATAAVLKLVTNSAEDSEIAGFLAALPDVQHVEINNAVKELGVILPSASGNSPDECDAIAPVDVGKVKDALKSEDSDALQKAIQNSTKADTDTGEVDATKMKMLINDLFADPKIEVDKVLKLLARQGAHSKTLLAFVSALKFEPPTPSSRKGRNGKQMHEKWEETDLNNEVMEKWREEKRQVENADARKREELKKKYPDKEHADRVKLELENINNYYGKGGFNVERERLRAENKTAMAQADSENKLQRERSMLGLMAEKSDNDKIRFFELAIGDAILSLGRDSTVDVGELKRRTSELLDAFRKSTASDPKLTRILDQSISKLAQQWTPAGGQEDALSPVSRTTFTDSERRAVENLQSTLEELRHATTEGRTTQGENEKTSCEKMVKAVESSIEKTVTDQLKTTLGLRAQIGGEKGQETSVGVAFPFKKIFKASIQALVKWVVKAEVEGSFERETTNAQQELKRELEKLEDEHEEIFRMATGYKNETTSAKDLIKRIETHSKNLTETAGQTNYEDRTRFARVREIHYGLGGQQESR